MAFQGSDDKGNQLLVRFARRQKHLAEIWLLLRMVDPKTHQVTIYCHPEHPNGILTGCLENVWSAKGLTCEMNEPMKRWRISYNGFMRYHSFIEYSEFFARKNFAFIEEEQDLTWPMLTTI